MESKRSLASFSRASGAVRQCATEIPSSSRIRRSVWAVALSAHTTRLASAISLHRKVTPAQPQVTRVIEPVGFRTTADIAPCVERLSLQDKALLATHSRLIGSLPMVREEGRRLGWLRGNPGSHYRHLKAITLHKAIDQSLYGSALTLHVPLPTM